MKRALYIVLFVLLCPLAYSQLLAKTRLGLQVNGAHEVSILGLVGEVDVETGFSYGGDLLYRFHPNAEFGMGYDFQIARSQVGLPGDFDFTTLYGAFRILAPDINFSPYLAGRVGYGFFSGDALYRGTFGVLSGDLYYFVGGGAQVVQFEWFASPAAIYVEIGYGVNQGSIQDDVIGYVANMQYSRVEFSIGVTNLPKA